MALINELRLAGDIAWIPDDIAWIPDDIVARIAAFAGRMP